MPKNPTIYDVAQHAGVSHMTVSRVLNPTSDSAKVAEKSRLKVMKAVEALGYKPNQYRTRRTGVLGFYADPNYVGDLFGNSYYSRMFEGALQKSHDLGQKLVLHQQSLAKTKDLQALFNDAGIDGAVYTGFIDASLLKQFKKDGSNIVLLDQQVDSDHVSSVTTEGYDGVYKATNYLLSLGHRRIAYINAKTDSKNFDDRLDAFQTCLRDNGIKPEKKLLVKGDAWSNGGFMAMNKLINLDVPPTAVMCANDNLAFYAMKAAYGAGLKIGQDISIMGFDNLLSCELVTPALSSIGLDSRLMGQSAIQLLHDQLDGGDWQSQRIRLQPDLVIRESTGALKKK